MKCSECENEIEVVINGLDFTKGGFIRIGNFVVGRTEEANKL